ncbi:hypothetical protein PQX77_008608 [Marasmius sp. AFHP31]|nr:hypothetical protein PQX77_008608 [Marasmius sp. AFHP31]
MTSFPPSSTSSTSSSGMQDDSRTSVVVNQMPMSGNLTEVPVGTVSTPFQQMNVESSHLRSTSTHTFSQISSLQARLRRLDDLLDGLRELHQLFQLAADEDIRMNGAEIISLVEVAQSTLTKAKIQLWRYSPCPVHFQPHQRLYFVILRDLRSRRFCFSVSLRRRWAVLIFHLSEDFKWGGPYSDDAYTPSWSQSLRSPPRTTPTDCVDTASRRTKPDSHTSIDESMPPPSAFPPSEGVSSLSLLPPPHKAKPLDILQFFPDVAFSLQARRPMKQRFGIFCTPKTSMFRPPVACRSKALFRSRTRDLISD